MDDGTFRFKDLAKHIADHNAPKVVSIGEDATRVIGRVDYDSETDRCVGFVFPVDGLPINIEFLPIYDCNKSLIPKIASRV